jgi:hypothetical protein
MAGWPIGGRWSLWRTSNAGNNWDSTGLYIPETNPNVWSFENSLYYFGSNIWFGARGKGIYYSSNDGTSWTLQDLTGSGFPYPSGIWFENATTGFSSGNLNIIRTTNGGANWTVTPGSTGTEVIRGITGLGSQWWYIREINPNIYYTSDNGNNWVIQHTSPSGVGFRHITKARTGNTLWAVNISGNVAKYVIPTGIEPLNELIPSAYKLFQNYPNPFNPETRIKFTIPPTTSTSLSTPGVVDQSPLEGGKREAKAASVSLIVYDVLGREVSNLVNDRLGAGTPAYRSLGAGTYEVIWDGSHYPSGVYFCTLRVGEFTETKKMLLIK